jgi:hypothetical protein
MTAEHLIQHCRHNGGRDVGSAAHTGSARLERFTGAIGFLRESAACGEVVRPPRLPVPELVAGRSSFCGDDGTIGHGAVLHSAPTDRTS